MGMTDRGVPVRCPLCHHEQLYAPPAFPCACGAPVVPPVARGAAVSALTDQTWADSWVTVCCPSCGRQGEWPQPELGCTCGAVLRIPVGPKATGDEPTGPAAPASPPAHIPLPRTAPRPRPAFHPVTIRDARDAVTVVALYLRWLGYLNTRSAARRPPSGVRITARGMLAQVEPSLRRTPPRDIECLWLSALTEPVGTPVTCAFFSLAGYTDEARSRADSLGVPLFTMDLTGTPRPVNSAADELIATGA
ncbi:hypothetical protein ACFWZ2_21580 [Streptomyces sp. NPDC059002]|uniref:hypothetical protein n=1 Tax=Streptomyces sp. NPDC059002 TaxID=3346690 RepID=UPI003678CBC8